jgi:hypothetical protein
MGYHEEAGQRYSGGRHVGLIDVRAAALMAKHESCDLWRTPEETRYGYPLRLIGCLVASPGDKGLILVPVKSHIVFAPGQSKVCL